MKRTQMRARLPMNGRDPARPVVSRAVMSVVSLGIAVVLVGSAPVSNSALSEVSITEAARQGDAKAVKSLLDGGADVNAAQGDGMTALHWAAERGHAEVANLLLSAAADVEAKTRIGSYTPLHVASRRGHVPIVVRLLEAGADPGAVTMNSGVTPLHLAAAAVGGTGAVVALLAYGADVNARENSVGQTPLMFAAGTNRAVAVKSLLSGGADPGLSTQVVDVLASLALDREASRRFREALGDKSARDVQSAIRSQREFLRSGYDVGEVDAHSLARINPEYPGGPDVVHPPYRETLVGKTGGMTALLHAAREGHIEATVALLDGGADVDQPSGGDRTSPLLMASLNGQFDLALVLLEHGADPDLAASTDGATPLFALLQTQWAPKSNYPQPRAQDDQIAEYMDVLRVLLEAGAEPNVRLKTHLWYWEYGLTKMGIDLTGATPFWRATFAQDLEAMKLLVTYGADPNIPTSWPEVGMRERRQQDGRQQEDSALPYIPEKAPNAHPIHIAAGGGYLGLGAFSVRNAPDQFLAAVKYLVEEHGADVNLADSWGYRPLHYAASRGDNELIEYLVSQGADVTAITRLGQSTADMARGGRAGFFTRVAYPETVDLLIGLGASFECLHTHFLDTGDFCPGAGVNDPWAQPVTGGRRNPGVSNQ